MVVYGVIILVEVTTLRLLVQTQQMQWALVIGRFKIIALLMLVILCLF